MPGTDRAPLDRAAVVEQALALLDDVGAERLSMRALAERLGTYPNVVYWHVGNRETVLSAVVDRVLAEMVLPDPDVPWRDWLTATATELRRVVHLHPAVAPLLSSRLLTSVVAMGPIEAVLACLARAGLGGPELVHAYNAYVGAVIGWVSIEVAEPAPGTPEWSEQLRAAIAEVDPVLHPTIAGHRAELGDRAIGLRWHSGRDRPLDDSFAVLVAALVEGLADLRPGG